MPDPIEAATTQLRRWQRRVAALVEEIDSLDAWSVTLPPHERGRLIGQGHFTAYAAELDWSPLEVVGHLRDSALVFAERIRRLRSEAEPLLADFDTTAFERIADYRATGGRPLAAQLRSAQTTLHRSVWAVEASQLELHGWHPVEGRMTVRDLLRFLPDHQRDHAIQLEALAAVPARERRADQDHDVTSGHGRAC